MIYTLYINISKVWALSFKIDLETGDECNVCTVFVMQIVGAGTENKSGKLANSYMHRQIDRERERERRRREKEIKER